VLTGDAPEIVGTDADPLTEALPLVGAAEAAGARVRLIGGVAVRVLCPGFTPRVRRDQDFDLVCLGKQRKQVAAFLESAGCEADRRFNNLNGDRQMYFRAPSGRPIDVMVDRVPMCHTLDFRATFSALPLTLGAADLLLTKLQIVELNEKDAHDIVHLLAGVPLGEGPGDADAPMIDATRIDEVLGADWGWWKTVTDNLDKLPGLVGTHPDLVPPDASEDAVGAARRLRERAERSRKTTQWKLRSRVGTRVRWYELPEEVDH
jgi:hypothetical protein